MPPNGGFSFLCSLSLITMRVLATLHGSTKSGPVTWEFVETAGGNFGATNGQSWKTCKDLNDLRSTYRKFLTYTKHDGTRTFSKQPVCA